MFSPCERPSSVTRYNDNKILRQYFIDAVNVARPARCSICAAAASQFPLDGNLDKYGFHPEGKINANPELDQSAERFCITPGFLATMRIPVLRGRDIADSDTADTPGVIMVNESTAKRIWPGEDALGKRVKVRRPRSSVDVRRRNCGRRTPLGSGRRSRFAILRSAHSVAHSRFRYDVCDSHLRIPQRAASAAAPADDSLSRWFAASFARDAAGRLRGHFRAGPAFLADFARSICCDCAAAFDDWNLWRHCVQRRAAHSRNWNPHGPGRATQRSAWPSTEARATRWLRAALP